MALTPITADQQAFAQRVARGTGLSLAAVLAWMRAEGGPTTNPLNIMIPGTQTVANYGSPERAADAVIANLKTSRYANVLQTARDTGDPKAQLTAIAQSPWDAGHYTAGIPGAAWGTTLLGSLASTKADPLDGIPGARKVVGVAEDVGNALDPGTWIRWITGTATTGLAYVVLTLLGVALVLIGLNEATGREATRHIAVAKGIPLKGVVA